MGIPAHHLCQIPLARSKLPALPILKGGGHTQAWSLSHFRIPPATESVFIASYMVRLTSVGFIEQDFLLLLESSLPGTSLSPPSVLCSDFTITPLEFGERG